LLSYFGLGTGTIAASAQKIGNRRVAQGDPPDFIRLLTPAIRMVTDINA
jgi:hypothetical protein